MLESGYTFLVIFSAWTIAGALLERYAPRVLERVGDWITR